MRKIIILLILSLALVISGSVVFANEVSQVKVVEKEIEGKTTNYSTVFDSSVSQVEINKNVDPDYFGYQINVQEMKLDESLNENEIKFVYNNYLDVSYDMEDQTAQCTLELVAKAKDEFSGDEEVSNYIDTLLNIWKTKTLKSETFSNKVFNVKVYYGKNLAGKITIVDSFDDEYPEDYSEDA